MMGLPANHPDVLRLLATGDAVDTTPGRAKGAGATQRPSLPHGVARVRVVVRIDGLALRSEANAGGSLKDKLARKKLVKDAVKLALVGVIPPPHMPPVRVRLVRVGGKRLDPDNLARSLKAVQDVVADNLLGCDDGDASRVRWSYHQRPGWKAGVMIVVG
jgi:hypothetical protein